MTAKIYRGFLAVKLATTLISSAQGLLSYSLAFTYIVSEGEYVTQNEMFAKTGSFIQRPGYILLIALIDNRALRQRTPRARQMT